MTFFTYRNRIHLLEYLNDIKVERACEVGVMKGDYTEKILSKIKSIKQLYLVDLWSEQANYEDDCNTSQNVYDSWLRETITRIKPWEEKTTILRGLSVEMCNEIPDTSLDWVYIDARHDYFGCKEDIESYWPKLKEGGIMSGHDYLEDWEVPGQDWSLCRDGSRRPEAVKGAVDEFASKHGLQVLVSYMDLPWPTWTIEKPLSYEWRGQDLNL